MEVREVLSREGREAKNLLVYQFCDETTTTDAKTGTDADVATTNPNCEGLVVNGVNTAHGNTADIGVGHGDCYQINTANCRKPPMPPKSPKNCPPVTGSGRCKLGSRGPRLRSASMERDKKTELQARYWALLFENLQRAINEIYRTAEFLENISSCQETILVLENYVRDFKALIEWFKVSWDYESRPPKQRPQSLAWEVRKSNPIPRTHTKSFCSPTGSGKSSPALYVGNSGKTSPCNAAPFAEGQISPKKMFRGCEQGPKGAMFVNVLELFAPNKRTSPNYYDISGEEGFYYVEMPSQCTQTDLEDPHLTLLDLLKRDAARRATAEQQLRQKQMAQHPMPIQQQHISMPQRQRSMPQHQMPMSEQQMPMPVQQVLMPVQQMPMGVQQMPMTVQQMPMRMQQMPMGVQQMPMPMLVLEQPMPMPKMPVPSAESMMECQHFTFMNDELQTAADDTQAEALRWSVQVEEDEQNALREAAEMQLEAAPIPEKVSTSTTTLTANKQISVEIQHTSGIIEFQPKYDTEQISRENQYNVEPIDFQPNPMMENEQVGVEADYTAAANECQLETVIIEEIVMEIPPPTELDDSQTDPKTESIIIDTQYNNQPVEFQPKSVTETKQIAVEMQNIIESNEFQPMPETKEITVKIPLPIESNENQAKSEFEIHQVTVGSQTTFDLNENEPLPETKPKTEENAESYTEPEAVPNVEPKSDTTAKPQVESKDACEPGANSNAESKTEMIVTQPSQEPTAVQMTVASMDAMENALLTQQANKEPTPPSTVVKPVAEMIKKTQSVAEGSANAGVTPTPMKYSSVLNRPPNARTLNTRTSNQQTTANAAGAPRAGQFNKPTSTSSGGAKTSVVNGIRRAPYNNINNNVNNNTSNNITNKQVSTRYSRPSTNLIWQYGGPARPLSRAETYGPPKNVATRMSTRSRTYLDINGNPPNSSNANTNAKPLVKRSGTTLSAINGPMLAQMTKNAPAMTRQSREDVSSSTSTLKASNEQLSSSRSTLKLDERHSEPKQLPSDANDGWLTVKNRRRSSMHWANRFNQPTGYASLPTLALLNEQKEQEEEKKIEELKNQANEDEQKEKEQPPKSKSIVKTETTKAASVDTNKSKTTKTTKPTAEKSKQLSTRPEIKNAKAKVNSFPPVRASNNHFNNGTNINSNCKKAEKRKTEPVVAEVAALGTSEEASKSSASPPVLDARAAIIKRQKSDLTGLKMTSLHKEYMRSEKNAQRKQQQLADQKANGSTVSSSAETVVEANKDEEVVQSRPERNKIHIKIQTNCEFSKTIGELYESLTKQMPVSFNIEKKDDSLASCDENDEQSADDVEQERNERMLVEVQESLERQIRELENTEIDVDTETDETDCEVVAEEHDDEHNDQTMPDDAATAVVFVMSNENHTSLELQYQALLSEMSCNERVEALATLEAYVARHPGRAQELHQKLSSPSRRRSLQETLKKYQAKQARAQQKRDLLQQEKASKLQQLFARVEDVKAAKKQLIEDKRLKMEGRLQRAAENREQYLRQIIEKAHDEEKKLKEINFIKNIEAQNKRLDLLESSKDAEGRLQDLEQERQKRVEEKAAKEAAVERRRQALEKERQLKLEKMNETRLEKEQRIGKMQEQKERQRQALAREKARDREERLLALQAQKQQTAEELQRKIALKQQESARRHEENMEQIRQRALELSIPTRTPDESQRDSQGDDNIEATKSVSGENDDWSTTSDAPNNGHSRSFKKKLKKLKQRMAINAAEYLASIEPLPVHMKRESSVPKLLNLILKGGGPQGLERALGNLSRLIPKAQVCDFQAFLVLDGLGVLTTHVINKGLQNGTDISKRAVTMAVQVYRTACCVCPQIARHAVLGNSIAAMFDALIKTFQSPEEKSPQHPVELYIEIMLACTEAIAANSGKKNGSHPKVPERLPDMINYAVFTGLIEMLARHFTKLRGSLEDQQTSMLTLLATLGLICCIIKLLKPSTNDPTRLISLAKTTDFYGIINMLCCCIVPTDGGIPKRTTSMAASAFNLLVSFANVNVTAFQDVLSSEGALATKLLDVIMLILSCAVPQTQGTEPSDSTTLIIDLIAVLSFFVLNNRKHQDLLISDAYAPIFKLLAKLSDYFNPIVYPLLLTVCYNHAPAKKVVGRDFDIAFLDEYSKSEAAQRNTLVNLMKSRSKKNKDH